MPAVLLGGNSRNVNIFLPTLLASKLIIGLSSFIVLSFGTRKLRAIFGVLTYPKPLPGLKE
jgi:type IV secretory pathway TrbD component